MRLVFQGHDYRYAVEQSLLAFFPTERPVYEGEDPNAAVVVLRDGGGDWTASTDLTVDGRTAQGQARAVLPAEADEYQRERLLQRAVKLSFFQAARALTGVTPAWGALTGIRPAKLAAGLLILLLLIPMLVFTALPNIFFGYDSSTTPEIMDLTTSAHGLEVVYQNIERKNQSVIDRLVESILPSFMTEDVPDYDDYTVEKSLGNVNHYWLIAIGSVRYKQDLNVMDEPTIEKLLSDKLTYTASITDRVLHISVRDLSPDAYMDKLGFTQEEKDWAALLYSVMADGQSVSPGDTDGLGQYGTDYGNVTFAHADTPVVYYNQTDARWGNKLYGRTGTIGWEGCGPTALAMVVASMTDNKVTPYDVAQWSVRNGYRCEGNGSYHSLIPNGGEHYGLTVDKIGKDSKKLVEALESGKLVIAIMAPGHFTTTGHFIVLRGITEEGKVLVADVRPDRA